MISSLKSSDIKRKTNKNSCRIFILTLMYFAAYLGFINRDILSTNTILKLRYLVVLLGSLYFVIAYLKVYATRTGKVLLPFVVKNWALLLLWFSFSIFTIISQSYNGHLPLEGIAYLIFTPLIFFLIIPIVLDNPEEIIIKSAFISSFIYLIVSILYEPVRLGSSYYGITYNPNSIGQLSVQAAISIFCLFLNALNARRKMKSLMYLFLFVISISFTLFSNSRTSLLVVLIACFFTLILFIKINKFKLRKLIVPVFILTFIYFLKLREILQVGIIDKFIRYSDNALAGRIGIWQNIINDITIFGHGPEYFKVYIGKGAHNSVLEIIGGNGIIAGIIITVFFLYSIVYSIKYAFDNKGNNFFYVPFIITITFFILGMAESMFGMIGKGITLVYFNIIGLMSFRKV